MYRLIFMKINIVWKSHSAPFGVLKQLKQHMEKVHADLPFAGSVFCPKCEKYLYKSNFRHHVKAFHPGELVIPGAQNAELPIQGNFLSRVPLYSGVSLI